MPFDATGPDVAGQLAAMNAPGQRLFERGQVVAVDGNDADLRVGYDAQGELLLREVPVGSGYAPRVGDWVAISYEGGHSGAPWVIGPSMAADAATDSAGVGVFSVTASAPPDPQPSMVYFDTALSTWRGWDGTVWRDFGSDLHNHLGGIQGGVASEHFHFSQGEHGALQGFYDGSAMASGYLQRLHLKAIDPSGTQRTTLFEKDGDCYWTVNATYDAATETWNRMDASKYAYLVGVHSQNGIPHEPGDLSGIAWWRVTPGPNPIGDYTAAGGWELGWMMTQHRNFVMGGMNLELDGSGSPPYGRLSQSGHEDPDSFTALLRNAWYEGNTGGAGSGSWGLDDATHPCWFAGFVDADGFVLKHRAAAAGPFHTTDWVKTLSVNGAGDVWVKRNLEVDGALTVGTLSGFVRANGGVLSASALQVSDLPTHTHLQAQISDMESGDIVTFGGVNIVNANTALTQGTGGRLVVTTQYGSLELGPANASYCHFYTDRPKYYFDAPMAIDGAVERYGSSPFTVADELQVDGTYLCLGNRNSQAYRAIITESGVNAENSAVLTTDAQKGRALALFGNGAAFFMGRDVTNDVEFGMGCSVAQVAFVGSMTNHGFEVRTNNAARIKLDGIGNLGFFGVTPVARQSVSTMTEGASSQVDTTARQKINTIITALQNLGLFQ
jgi:hypothetical protein